MVVPVNFSLALKFEIEKNIYLVHLDSKTIFNFSSNLHFCHFTVQIKESTLTVFNISSLLTSTLNLSSLIHKTSVI